ncbi:GATA transcription factor 15-like protein [Tanacetum coccineum]
MRGSMRSGSESEEESKSCLDCKTTSTPLWRGGPDGPKTLCNACGIKYNKKRRAQIRALDQNGKKISKSAAKPNSDLKLNVRSLVANENQKPQQRQQEKLQQQQQQQRQQVKLQQQRQQVRLQQEQQQPRKRSTYERGKPWWNKLGEEEQAAILLMSISCGGSKY